jgi:hypothetical protein
METALDIREARGRQLAAATVIKRVGRRWAVPSQTSASNRYLVDIEDSACTCPDYELRKGTCKHQHAVLYWIAWGRDVAADGSVTETIAVKRKTYPQRDWSAYNASQHHEREYVERLLRALCALIVQPPRKPGPGRNPCLLSDLVFSAVMKVYTMLSGRRMKSDLEACAAKGHLSHVRHENSIQRERPVRGRFHRVLDRDLRPLVRSEARQTERAAPVGEAARHDRHRDPRDHGREGVTGRRLPAVARAAGADDEALQRP